jgi:hypothetical protein
MKLSHTSLQVKEPLEHGAAARMEQQWGAAQQSKSNLGY